MASTHESEGVQFGVSGLTLVRKPVVRSGRRSPIIHMIWSSMWFSSYAIPPTCLQAERFSSLELPAE